MENLIKNLDGILKSVQQLKEKYQVAIDENHQLEAQLSTLKVEADQYKQEISNLKKELEESVEGKIKSTISTQNNISGNSIEALKQEQKLKNEQVRLQLDGFIEDIDQCIQIIQAKE